MTTILTLTEMHMARIGVAMLGGPGWPRYALHDERYRYWIGTDWSSDVKGAALFASEQAAAVEYERVLSMMRAGQPVREYTARVTVRVVGDEQYEPARLKKYLSAACRLHLNSDTLDGPAPDAAVTVEIEWDRLRPGIESAGGGM